MKEFILFSKNNRESFLETLSNLMSKDINFIANGDVFIFYDKIDKLYQNYLLSLFNSYTTENNLVADFDSLIHEFTSFISEQCHVTTPFTKEESLQHLFAIEYNMIINIHRFSFELFILNHTLDEKKFFYGERLEDILGRKEMTLMEFREKAYYDTDNIDFADINEDTVYIKDLEMFDIYFLTILSTDFRLDNYTDLYYEIYKLKHLNIISDPLYRFLITTEDSIKARMPIIKSFINAIVIVILLTIGLFFVTQYIIKKF